MSTIFTKTEYLFFAAEVRPIVDFVLVWIVLRKMVTSSICLLKEAYYSALHI